MKIIKQYGFADNEAFFMVKLTRLLVCAIII